MSAETLRKAHKWLGDLMVNGEYCRRECCWTNPDKEGHKPGCELELLMKQLQQLAEDIGEHDMNCQSLVVIQGADVHFECSCRLSNLRP